MNIYEVLQCDACKRTYKGKFKWHMDGKVTCANCNDPEVFLGLQIEEIQYAQRSRLMYTELSEMLIKDLENIYPLFPDKYAELIDKLESGDMDSSLPYIYFQYNPYQLVRISREVAYVASYFLLKPEEILKKHPQLERHANKFINMYFALRERQLEPQEHSEYWLLASHEALEKMKQHLPVLYKETHLN